MSVIIRYRAPLFAATKIRSFLRSLRYSGPSVFDVEYDCEGREFIISGDRAKIALGYIMDLYGGKVLSTTVVKP